MGGFDLDNGACSTSVSSNPTTSTSNSSSDDLSTGESIGIGIATGVVYSAMCIADQWTKAMYNIRHLFSSNGFGYGVRFTL